MIDGKPARLSRLAALAPVLLVICPSPLLAWGDSGCGTCDDFPPEKAASVEQLEGQLGTADLDHVRRLVFVGEICAPNGFDCGNMTEEEAKGVANWYLQSHADWWDSIEKIGLFVIAAAGLWLGLLNRYRPRT